MARRLLNVTEEWQVASVRPAIFTIVQVSGAANQDAILFNDVEDGATAEQYNTESKNLQILQPEQKPTYVRSEKKPNVEGRKEFIIVVDD